MMRKLLIVLVLAIAGSVGTQAQQAPAQPTPTPADQTPANPPQQSSSPSSSSSSQEASDDELGRHKKIKVTEYEKWTYNIGFGANLPRSTTDTFVKGGGLLGDAGIARNFNRYFGFRFDFQWVDLPLRVSALQEAQAPSGSNHVYAFTLDPILNVPVTKLYTAYALVGPGYYHRSGKLDSSTAVPGSPCNAFYTWWGSCFISSLPINGKFLSESLNEFGYNFGGGVDRKIGKKLEVYGEFRQQHGARNKITTDWKSLTVGVRW
ncbi:MAG TPA: hypothetical protein VI386_05705 [Candidatus Sulfotelmatobacter sp.]